MAVSGAILITFVPLPRKNARAVPGQATTSMRKSSSYLGCKGPSVLL